jgi:ureidoacrylate peracid hydrolase
LSEAAPEFELYPELEVRSTDSRVTKIHYSALVVESSNLNALLRERGIETLLVAGTATNVCCESTARDAMMLDYRTIMVSDANATWTDAEHSATLDLFVAFFGDVLTTDEAIARL